MQWVWLIRILHYLSVILQVMRRLIDVELLGYLVLENNDGLRFGVIREQVLDAVEPLYVLLLDVSRVRVMLAAIHAALNNEKVLQELHLLAGLHVLRWQVDELLRLRLRLLISHGSLCL